MLPAARSRLCNRDSAWVVVFARRARSSVLFGSVLVSVGYRLHLATFRVNQFSFI